MAYLTKEQVKNIIKSAPAGTTPQGIVGALRLKGYTLEGFDQTSSQDIKDTPKSDNKNVFDKYVGGFATGLGSSILSTAKGLGDLVGLKPTPFGERLLSSGQNLDKGIPKAVGRLTGDVTQIAAPVGEVASATKALPKILQVGARALTTAGVVTAQEGKLGLPAVAAGGIELAAPVAGVFLRPVTRFIKSLASGLSGESVKVIESIVANPTASKQSLKEIENSGVTSILKKNAETIINGVSKIRREASAAYRNGVEALKSTDINPSKFRQTIQPILDSVGSYVNTSGKRVLRNVEFDTPMLLKKASRLIDKVSTTALNGFELRKTLSTLENSLIKTTGSDANRLAYNAFVNNLINGVREAIGKSTSKLDEINKAYSTDLQLTQALENELGKVKFKSLAEITKVSKNLENLFSKTGLSPEVIDKFLTRIGVSPSSFRASEAVRQISDTTLKGNSVGLNIAEITRGVTSSIVSPKAVRDISILTGIAKENIKPILDRLTPIARLAFIKLLTNPNQK